MVRGPLTKGILAYAIPLALTGMLQKLFNAADTAVVGQFVGKEAMAAVGTTAPIICLIVNFFTGISLGTNIVIAHMTGSDDKEGVKKAVHTSVLFALLGGTALAVIGEVFASVMLRLLSVPEEVLPMTLTYLRIYFLGLPMMMLCNYISAILRSRGDLRTPMIAMSVSGVLNVILNLILVILLGMTVDGVALATLISNTVCAAWLVMTLIFNDGDIRLDLRSLKIDAKILKKILFIGLPAGVQSMVFQIANLYVQSAVNSLGTVAMAACAASGNVEGFIYDILQSFGYACATFVGQNTGAGNDRRCAKVLRRCFALDYLLTASVCLVLVLLRYRVMALFNPDPGVIEFACVRMLFLFVSYIFSIPYEICSGYLRGYDDPLPPSIIALVAICGIRFAWIAFYFPYHREFTSLMLVFPVSIGITAIVVSLWALVFGVRRKKNGQSAGMRQYAQTHG